MSPNLNCSKLSSGYEDDRCQTDTDECAATPCQNSGACADSLTDVVIAAGQFVWCVPL